jgi:hypothetical protein
MTSDFNTIRYILPKLSKGNYTTLMKMLHNSLTFDVSDAAKFRLYVLDHYYKYGWKATIEAFRIGKSTLYDWRKAFEKSGKRLTALIPVSTRPIHTRKMTVDLRFVEFIKSVREDYGNVSKYKLKVFIDEYARKINTETISVSLIGKVIRRKNFFFEGRRRTKRVKTKLLYPRIKYAPKERNPGYIEMDSVTIYVLGRKYYFITAIDIVTKYAWVKLVTSLSSLQAKEALIEFMTEYNRELRVVQTDNGSEFLKEFNKYLQDLMITHQFIYQKLPKVNAVVERFNRTIQEEFIERNIHEIYDTNQFRVKLVKYLVWYNTKRPHYSLNYRTPVQYLTELTNIPKST